MNNVGGSPQKLEISVIGAGAAGYFASIAASDPSSNNTTLFEASQKPLAKLLISGGGRCNVTNTISDPKELIKNYPRGSKELLGAFHYFNSADTVEWFKKRGVDLHTEADGRMFPITNESRTIEKCLKEASKNSGVQVILGKKIIRISKNEKFEIEFSTGEIHKSDRIILATGSSQSGYKIAESLGHKITKTVPSLFTFEIKDSRLKDLSGISFERIEAELINSSGKSFKQIGPMLITHWGLSGPAIIKLSAWGALELFESDYYAKVKINFLPGTNYESCLKTLNDRKKSFPKKILINDSFLNIPKSYWERIIVISEIQDRKLWADLSKVELQRIAQELTNSEFQISGKGKFKEEFVTCGGVSLKEVDFRRMESKICPGLFFAGEILDIDGVTGGFNFQAAWTTGLIAGENSRN